MSTVVQSSRIYSSCMTNFIPVDLAASHFPSSQFLETTILLCFYESDFSFCFVWLHPQHMAVPRLGVESELQLQPVLQPQHRRIWAASLTDTTAHGNAGSLTHWAGPEIQPESSWILVGFITRWATTGTPETGLYRDSPRGPRAVPLSDGQLSWEMCPGSWTS